ncbi:MAG: hypothetical protein K2U26_10325 [Cyclobacteriaceae bacterium]|nr:hypothetical protein [Cyclobacteriaceae bacterium]
MRSVRWLCFWALLTINLPFYALGQVDSATHKVDSVRRARIGFYADNVFLNPDFGALNNVLVQQGFAGIKERLIGASFGYSFRPVSSKDSYTTLKVSFVTTGNMASNASSKVAGIQLFEFSSATHYDLITSPKWLVYPYGGFGFQFGTLSLVDNTFTQNSFASSISNLNSTNSKSLYSLSVFANLGGGVERRLRIGYYDFYVGLSGGYRVSTNSRFRELYQNYTDAPVVRLSGFEWNFRIRFEIWNTARFQKSNRKTFQKFK